MINKIRENWDQILDIMRIEHDISPVAFNTWIKPLTVYSVEGHTITILVNNELEQMCSYIKKKFEQPLKVTISEYFNDVYDIHITTSEELGKIEATQTVEPEKKPAASIITNKTLNPNYTFDTFVVGKNNELAHATALAVASAVHLRRCWTWKDAFNAFHRTLHSFLQSRLQNYIHNDRNILQ